MMNTNTNIQLSSELEMYIDKLLEAQRRIDKYKYRPYYDYTSIATQYIKEPNEIQEFYLKNFSNLDYKTNNYYDKEVKKGYAEINKYKYKIAKYLQCSNR